MKITLFSTTRIWSILQLIMVVGISFSFVACCTPKAGMWDCYEVKPGDCILSISARFHLDWRIVCMYNRQLNNCSNIEPGQLVLIPNGFIQGYNCQSSPTILCYFVQEDDSLPLICYKFNYNDARININPQINVIPYQESLPQIVPEEAFRIPLYDCVPTVQYWCWVPDKTMIIDDIIDFLGISWGDLVVINDEDGRADGSVAAMIPAGRPLKILRACNQTDDYFCYKVQPGDYLNLLSSSKFNVNAQVLCEFNELANCSAIYVNQTIKIPSSNKFVSVRTPQESCMNCCLPLPSQWVCHAVQQGETLEQLAATYAIPTKILCQYNYFVLPQSDCSSLPTGILLKIPIGNMSLYSCFESDYQYCHVIQPGDTWDSIQRAYYMPINTLCYTNSQYTCNAELPRYGMMRIPKLNCYPSDTVICYIPPQNLTLKAIADLYGYSLSTLFSLNSDRLWAAEPENIIVFANKAIKFPKLCTDSLASYFCYKVQVGDTLPALANMFGVSVSDLCSWNALPNCTLSVLDAYLRIYV